MAAKKEALEHLLLIGAQLSNIAYNAGQGNRAFNEHGRLVARQCAKEWDEALREYRRLEKAKAPK